MALPLPALKSIQDAASYSDTVTPYLSTISTAVSSLISIRTLPALQQWYTSTNPLISSFIFSQFIAAIALISSEINRNYSQIDRLWSILPVLHIGHYALFARLSGIPSERLDVAATVAALWGARLTFNYWRKGGYKKGEEDYRWAVLRKHIPKPLFTLFNITFISWYQSVLLFLVSTPGYVMFLLDRVPVDEATAKGNASADFWFSRGIMLAILLEFFADQQQWNFHKAKHAYKKTGDVPKGFTKEDLDRGFLCDGLWAFSRHPNFLGEQLVWVLFYQWTCNLTDTLYNWTVVGAIQYLLLFQGSTMFTEYITAGKYPEYKDYQACVGKFLPSYKALLGTEDLDEKLRQARLKEMGNGEGKKLK